MRGSHPDNFAALRLLAAVLVIYGHAFTLAGQAPPGLLGSPAGTIAVKIFFVISGFLITVSWDRDSNYQRYLARRCLRIFPALGVVVLFTIFIVGAVYTSLPLSDYVRDDRAHTYLWNFFLYPIYSLPGVFETNPYPGAVNGSLWTLPVEFALYLALPLILVVDRRVRFFLPLVAAATLLFALVVNPNRTASGWVVYGTSIPAAAEMIPYFLAGATYQRYQKAITLNHQYGLLLLLIAPFFVAPRAIMELFLYLSLPYVVLSFAKSANAAFMKVERVGDLSYGVYLYGFVIQQSFAATAGSYNTPFLNAAVSVAVSLMLAKLSWHFIERPALTMKPASASTSRRAVRG